MNLLSIEWLAELLKSTAHLYGFHVLYQQLCSAFRTNDLTKFIMFFPYKHIGIGEIAPIGVSLLALYVPSVAKAIPDSVPNLSLFPKRFLVMQFLVDPAELIMKLSTVHQIATHD